jgi:hypothetical protein
MVADHIPEIGRIREYEAPSESTGMKCRQDVKNGFRMEGGSQGEGRADKGREGRITGLWEIGSGSGTVLD